MANNDRLAAMREAELEAAPGFDEAEDGAEDVHKFLPSPCPVTPLGINGKNIVFLDGLKQIVTAPTKCDKGDLMLWFGNGYLEAHYGNDSDSKKADRWDQRKIQTDFIEDCRNLGLFDPSGRVFGRGAHRGPLGGHELVMHLGNLVMIADPSRTRVGDRMKTVNAGTISLQGERLFYPAGPPLPPPANSPATPKDAQSLLDTFRGFNFVHSTASPLLLLGMVGQMYLCGALRWRSHMWITAPTGAGKTTLQNIVRECLQGWCLHTEEATEPSIRQVLKDDTLPVLIDEAEGHDRPEQKQAIINLMKRASAGGKIHRGGADHKHTEFTAQSCFMLTSVLHAPLRGEDRNRMAILEMRAITDNSPPPPLALELATWRTLGRRFHRRMIMHWDRWERTYDAYRRAIAELGYVSRTQDTYGTLLACADLMRFDYGWGDITLSDEPGEERVLEAVKDCVSLMEESRNESEGDDVRCRRAMLGAHLPGYGGKPPEPIGRWIERAMTWLEEPSTATQFNPDGSSSSPDDPFRTVNQAARDRLKNYGLAVVKLHRTPSGAMGYREADPEDWKNSYLAVAGDTNQALAQIMKDTDWRGGGWKQSLGKVPGVEKCKVRFFEGALQAQCVPLEAMTFRGEGE